MPRPSHPWWWKERERWAVTVAGKRYLAPDVLTEKDWLAARDWHARLLEELRPGTLRKAGELTVADICIAYLDWDRARIDSGERNPKSYAASATQLGLFCATEVDGKRLAAKLAIQFTAGDLWKAIAIWRADHKAAVAAAVAAAPPGRRPVRRGYRSEGYICAIVQDVRSAFSWANRPVQDRIPERLLPENPLEGFLGPTMPGAEHRYAQPREAADWLKWLVVRKVNKSFVLLQRALIHSGARPSEMVKAQWKHITWDGYKTDDGHWMAIVTLKEHKTARKTGKERRIFLSPPIRAALMRVASVRGNDPEGHLFLNNDGNPWANANSMGNQVMRQRDAAIRADLEAKAKDPSIRIRFREMGAEALVNYRWRHTAASTLLMNGIDITTTAELLGTSEEMIRETYGHLLIDHLGKAAKKGRRRRRQ